MINIKNIFPECDSDTLLVELITQRGKANHNKGVSKVEKAMQRLEQQNNVLIAVIDSDKFKNLHENKYIYSFDNIIIDKANCDEALVLKKLPNKNNYAAFLCPEFEPWIWKQANLAKINTIEYGFPDLATVYKVSKHFGTNESKEFKRFVNAVVVANPPGITLLKKWLVDNDFTG